MGFTTAKTPNFLQSALVKEIERITGDLRFFSSRTNERTEKLKVYSQCLPKLQKESKVDDTAYVMDYSAEMEEDVVRECPWCVVKINSGSITEVNGKQRVTMAIQFAIYDNRPQNQGHLDILSLIFLVYQRFAKDPLLDRQYGFTGEINWGLGEEDTWPYFTGVIVLEFEFAGIRRESKYT